MVVPGPVALQRSPRTLTQVAGGVAAAVAGLCWLVKAVAILATGQQPPLLFELAPVLMAAATLVLGRQLRPGRARTVCVVAASGAVVGGTVVLINQVARMPTVAFGIAMAGTNILVLVGLVAAGASLRQQMTPLPLVLGAVTIPALLLGGLLAEVLGERALEVPLVGLGVAWVVLGIQLGRGRYAAR